MFGLTLQSKLSQRLRQLLAIEVLCLLSAPDVLSHLPEGYVCWIRMQIIHLFLNTLAHSLIALFCPLSQPLVRAAQLLELFFDFGRGLLTWFLPVGLLVRCELDVRMLHLGQFQVDRADLFGLAVLGQPESRQVLRYLRRQRHQPRTMVLPTSSAAMEVLLAFLALLVVKRLE